MSTQQPEQAVQDGPGSIELYAGVDDGKQRIATQLQLDWFKQQLEHELAICNNCFSKREDSASHFRSTGGATAGGGAHQDATADLFCTNCDAGTGKVSLHRPHDGEWDEEEGEWTTESGRPAVDYSNVHSHLGERFIRDMAGTIGREWNEGQPLPKTGSLVSFSRLITNIGQRLEESGYEITDWDSLRENAERLKTEHPNRDREILARVFSEAVENHYTENEFETVTIEPITE